MRIEREPEARQRGGHLLVIERKERGEHGTAVERESPSNPLQGIFDRGLKFRSMVFPDTFIDQMSPEDMYAVAGMNAPQIEAKVLEVLGVARMGERRA